MVEIREHAIADMRARADQQFRDWRVDVSTYTLRQVEEMLVSLNDLVRRYEEVRNERELSDSQSVQYALTTCKRDWTQARVRVMRHDENVTNEANRRNTGHVNMANITFANVPEPAPEYVYIDGDQMPQIPRNELGHNNIYNSIRPVRTVRRGEPHRASRPWRNIAANPAGGMDTVISGQKVTVHLRAISTGIVFIIQTPRGSYRRSILKLRKILHREKQVELVEFSREPSNMVEAPFGLRTVDLGGGAQLIREIEESEASGI